MPEEKNGESGFKVVDRRSFSADGTPREGDPAPDEHRGEPSGRLVATPSTQFEAEPAEDLVEGATDFETLVSYLSTTALFQLGLLAGPSGERIPADLLNAQRTINLLEVLQDKTRGNLTPDEERVLEATLYELRLGFVEVDKRQAKKGK
jgi:hypothetical protein